MQALTPPLGVRASIPPSPPPHTHTPCSPPITSRRLPQIEEPAADRRRIRLPQVLLPPESAPGAGDGLPRYSWHAWRYLTADPVTNSLYIAVGAPCNVPGDGELEGCAASPFATVAAVRPTPPQRLVQSRT